MCSCDREKKNLYNTFFIYIITVVLSVLIYLKFGISVECVQYMVLIPFLIIISIVDYYTIYVYDITIVSGIIVQGIIFGLFQYSSIWLYKSYIWTIDRLYYTLYYC